MYAAVPCKWCRVAPDEKAKKCRRFLGLPLRGVDKSRAAVRSKNVEYTVAEVGYELGFSAIYFHWVAMMNCFMNPGIA